MASSVNQPAGAAVIQNDDPASAKPVDSPDQKSPTEVSTQWVDCIDPNQEAAFVRRLGLGFLLIEFLGYTFKYIDQTNISNAYVSGMKEDLSLYSNELNYFTTYFNIGYMVMLYPSRIIISHIGPSVWLPMCEVSYALPGKRPGLTKSPGQLGRVDLLLGCSYAPESSKIPFASSLPSTKEPTLIATHQVYGLRFLIGFFEGTAWPVYLTMISQWYLPHGVSLRMSLYNIAQPTGAMISGAMQGALATNFDGVLGRAGWRWAFIINGVCTILVALGAFVLLPGYPERQNPLSKFYLKPKHMEIAQARVRRIGRKPQAPITIKSFLRCFSFWQLWALAIFWPLGGNMVPSNFFNLWLKSLTNSDASPRYSVGMLNYLPIVGQAIQLVAEVLFSGLSDYFRARLPFILFHSAISIMSLAILIVRPSNERLHMAGYYLNYVGGVLAMLACSWASDNLQHEPELRTVLFASGTLVAYALAAFVPISAYPASDAPHWRIGAKLYMSFAVICVGAFISIHFAFKWEARRRQKAVVEEEQEDRGAERPVRDSKF
ncbi:hypothetical protein ACJZ2D_013410 [Fusarium nematophilum]